MAGAVELHGHVGRHDGGMDLTVDAVEAPPELRVAPADQALRVVPAVEPVVGDVEVARPRVVREDADADVLETGVLDREPLRPRDELLAGPDGELGVAKRDALEIGVVGRHDVEEGEVAVAVEDDLAVTRRLDGNRPLGRTVGRQVVRALEGKGAVGSAVLQVVVAVEAGVHEEGVAGAHPGTPGRGEVPTAARGVVRAYQPLERRLDLRALEAMGIDVEHPPLRVRYRLGARPHGHRPAGLSDHAVGIGHHEPRLVRRVGLQVEDAPREHVRNDDVELISDEDPLALQAQEGQRRRPLRLALPAIRRLHRRVPVVVALDGPFEAEVDQRRRLDQELSRRDRVLRRIGPLRQYDGVAVEVWRADREQAQYGDDYQSRDPLTHGRPLFLRLGRRAAGPRVSGYHPTVCRGCTAAGR